MTTYLVLLSQIQIDRKLSDEETYFNGIDYQGQYKYYVTSDNQDGAVSQALNHYYKNFWMHYGHNEDKIQQKIYEFKESLDKLDKETGLYNPYKPDMLLHYENEIRSMYDGGDISPERFGMFSIPQKIQYLESIKCNIEYYVIPQQLEQKFDTINL